MVTRVAESGVARQPATYESQKLLGRHKGEGREEEGRKRGKKEEERKRRKARGRKKKSEGGREEGRKGERN